MSSDQGVFREWVIQAGVFREWEIGGEYLGSGRYEGCI